MIEILALSLTLLFLVTRKRTPQSDVSRFGSALYHWLMGKEGGLSNSNIDSELNRAPCTVYKSGKIMSPPPHTSRGVIWDTFVSLAPILKYEPTCENFMGMSDDQPNDIWYKIVDYIRKKGFKYSNNPVLGTYIGLWYWGGWDQTIITPAQVAAVIESPGTNKGKLFSLVQLRKDYFTELVRRKPTKAPALQGWINRANEYYENFSQFA